MGLQMAYTWVFSLKILLEIVVHLSLYTKTWCSLPLLAKALGCNYKHRKILS